MACGSGRLRIHQLVVGVSVPGRNAYSASALRGLVSQALQAKLGIGHPQNWTVFTGIELDRVVLIADVSALKHARRIPEVEFPGLPGQQALLDLLGEFV